MNVTPNFRNFFALLLVVFLFTWFGLVVFPWLELGHLPPIAEEGSTDITPWDSSGAAHAGEHIYAANGCAYCHTQQVRPANSGADIIRGWGTATDQDDPKKQVIRRSYPRDYIWQGQVFLGNSRNGADLSNVAEPAQQHARVSFSFRHAQSLRTALPGGARPARGRRAPRRLRNCAHGPGQIAGRLPAFAQEGLSLEAG
jgi:cytochrome c oxidase cbb3-type subunit II